MVGRSENPVLGSVPWVVASFLKQTGGRRQTTQEGQNDTTGRDPETEPEQKTRGQERPHTQDTRRQAGEPSSFPHVSGSTFSSLTSATERTQQERATLDPHPVWTARCNHNPSGTCRAETSLTYKAETDLYNASVSRPTRRSSSRTGITSCSPNNSTRAKSSSEYTPPL